jgi:hypothetical protein
MKEKKFKEPKKEEFLFYSSVLPLPPLPTLVLESHFC